MKLKRILIVAFVIFITVASVNSARAYTINVKDVHASKGKEFTVKLNVDTATPLANGHIKFDSSKVDFVRTTQEKMQSSIVSDGDLAWIYIDLNGEGVKSFEFTFKVKDSGESEMKFEDLAFVDCNQNEFDQNHITGDSVVKVNKKSYGIYIVILIVVAFIYFIKKR